MPGRLTTLFALVLVLFAGRNGAAAEQASNVQNPVSVVEAYLRASYARDYIEAYQYLSSADRRIKDQNRYAQQKGQYQGFALVLMKKMAEFIEVKSAIKSGTQNGLQVIARTKAPDTSKLSDILLDGNTYVLNSLPLREQNRILDSIAKRGREGSLPFRSSEEVLELMKEGNQWRIFFDWATGIRIPLKALLSSTPQLDVSLSKSEVVVQSGDVFDVSLRIKNRSNKPLMAQIVHVIEPQAFADHLDFVECGFLLPITINPGDQEYLSRYVVRWSIPEGIHQMSLSYDFKPLH